MFGSRTWAGFWYINDMTTPEPKPRWFLPTPGKVLLVLLSVEVILFLAKPWMPRGWAVLFAIAAVGVFLIGMLLWLLGALVFHRRFQFSLRTLLVLMVAVAVPFSWLSVEMKKAREQKEAVDKIDNSGGRAFYDYINGIHRTEPGLKQLIDLLSDDFFKTAIEARFQGKAFTDDNLPIYLNNLPDIQAVYIEEVNLSENGLGHLKHLTSLELLNIRESKISDAGLMAISEFPHLTTLVLSYNAITDDGVKALSRMKGLRKLELERTKITDVGLSHLQNLTNLEELFLDETSVTDAGLRPLKVLCNLKILSVRNTQVTDKGIKELQQALPDCFIDH
jgi:hypothetical protein